MYALAVYIREINYYWTEEDVYEIMNPQNYGYIQSVKILEYFDGYTNTPYKSALVYYQWHNSSYSDRIRTILLQGKVHKVFYDYNKYVEISGYKDEMPPPPIHNNQYLSNKRDNERREYHERKHRACEEYKRREEERFRREQEEYARREREERKRRDHAERIRRQQEKKEREREERQRKQQQRKEEEERRRREEEAELQRRIDEENREPKVADNEKYYFDIFGIDNEIVNIDYGEIRPGEFTRASQMKKIKEIFDSIRQRQQNAQN